MENAIKTAVGFFVLIVVGALLSALLGGLFGSLVATISPEFVLGIFHESAHEAVARYSFAVGMIWGLFVGAAATGFACFLAAIIKILRIRLEYQKAQKA
jgi:hypothetical protein